jgi:hypothetical protein
MTGISSQLLLAKNLNILHTFGEYPAKLENIKDFQSSLWYLEIRTITISAFYPFTRHSAAQTFPDESEAGNLDDVFAMFCLSSFIRKMRCCHSGGVINLFVTNEANSIPQFSG